MTFKYTSLAINQNGLSAVSVILTVYSGNHTKREL